jgi:hypothetical protein
MTYLTLYIIINLPMNSQNSKLLHMIVQPDNQKWPSLTRHKGAAIMPDQLWLALKLTDLESICTDMLHAIRDS